MMKNFFLCIVALVVSLALVEGVLRLYPERFEVGRKVILDNDQGVDYYATCYSTPPEDGFNVQLNSKDRCVLMRNKYNLTLLSMVKLMRETPFCIDYDIEQRQKGFFPERDKDLFIVGDSFAFGEGVLEQGTLAYILAEHLQTYNVRNFAQSGANIKHIDHQIKAIVEHHPSPYIIYFFNLNDPLHSKAMTDEQRLIADFQNIRPEFIEPPGPFWQFWEKMKCIKLARQAWALSREKRLTINYYHRLYFGADNAADIKETFNIISKMENFVAQAGGRFVLVIYPLIHKDMRGHYPFQDIHDEIKKRCDRNHIPCIDGLGAFNKYRSMKPFRVHAVDYHPNARANRIMVTFLVDKKKLAGYFE